MGLFVLVSACGAEPAKLGATKVKPFDASIVPGELLGLTVTAEEIGGAKEVKDPFVEGVGLYSLRSGELLQGTLQVSRFSKDADSEKSRFRRAVVQQIGSTIPKAYRMGRRTVYLTAGKRQSIAVWFEGRYFFVLSTRDEFDQPRALLREALEIKP
ncbi:MAG TPA: hypothetical protein VM143_17960 [Acidimicrobiales bacterium]|nr:hypothetical protein [Acidimicrobiales bacterium]